MKGTLFIFSTLAAALAPVAHGQGQNTSPNSGQGAVPPSSPPGLQRKIEILAQLGIGVPPKFIPAPPNPLVQATPEEFVASIDIKGRLALQGQIQAAALAKAKEKTIANDLAAAEEFLTVTNPYNPDSARWHLDAAQQWLALAQDLSKEKNSSKVPAATTQTLAHLDQAATIARQQGDIQSEAAAKNSAAFVHERFRGDIALAIANYKAVLTLQPQDEMARHSLSRLENSLANLQAKVRNPKSGK